MSVSIIANKQNILTLHSIINNEEETGIDISNTFNGVGAVDEIQATIVAELG